jgi:hypothetical protein
MRDAAAGQEIPYWRQTDKSAAQLRAEFLALIDEAKPEQAYQQYMEENTRLVPR